jgi:RNA polymerase sigma factor (sigma-70 family)
MLSAVNESRITTEFQRLIARVRQGEDTAMAELVAQYEPRVRAAARVLLGPALRPHLDSLDLAQSVHRTLFLGLRQDKFELSDPQQLVALLLTVVRRKVAHEWRRAQRQQRLSQADQLPADDAGEPTAEEAAVVNEAIARVLDSLEGVDRRMIELRLAGLRTSEVARQLGLDARVLRARLSRLRQRLRDEGVLSEWL